MCQLHYQRLKKAGRVDIVGYGDAAARFVNKIEISDEGCWEWRGTIFPKTGYGSFWSNGRTGLSHRWSYEHYVGEIPKGYEIDHLCRNRACCNPDHLEAVTPAENKRRAVPFRRRAS